MGLHDTDSERAESYRIIAEFYLKPPNHDVLQTLKEDFELNSREGMDLIEEDFHGLFSFPDGRLLPFESLYLSRQNGMTAHEVADFYAAAGLFIEEDLQMMPDHLYLEFAFMSYLIETRRYEMQQKFIRQHIINWVPDFCDEAIKTAKTTFYKEIAEITKDFVLIEYEEIY